MEIMLYYLNPYAQTKPQSKRVISKSDIIIGLSNQLPLITSLEKRFIKYITNGLYCANSFVNVVTKFALCNPMSSIGELFFLIQY